MIKLRYYHAGHSLLMLTNTKQPVDLSGIGSLIKESMND
jgi:hypothetical protein